MRKISWIPLAFAFLLSLGSPLFGQGSPSGKALSLRALQNRLQECQKKGPCPDELLRMAGIRIIKGYLVDEKNRDIILFGQTDENRPPLYLEDWVINIQAGPNNFSRDGTGRAASLRAEALKARPAPEALSWFFPFP